MKKMKRLIACAAAAITVLTAGTAIAPTKANAELVQIGWRGDVNYDGILSIVDVVVLQKHILGIESIPENMMTPFADVLEDDKVNVSDLNLLKKCLVGGVDWIGIFEEQQTEEPTKPTEPDTPDETPFIGAAISAVGASLPSVGDAALVIFYIDFPDCTYASKLSADEVQSIAFGPEQDADSSFYPFESMSAFFNRSSKGRMNLTGKVFSYTAKNSISSYNENKVAIVEECYEAFKDSEDFSQYDKNNDGKIDATLLTVPSSASSDYWWPCAGGFGDPEYEVDGKKIGHIITGNSEPADHKGFNSTYLHEMGHCMGLPDYYLYYSDDSEGMNGSSGTELMDTDAYSDFCAYSKLMLGWYRENQVDVFDTNQGSQTFTLKPAQSENGNCVIIPNGTLDENYCSEYFVIEYETTEGNNSGITRGDLWWQNVESGVRIIHVYGEMHSDYWWTYLKYQNGSEYTGYNDEGIRLIRLVNDGNGPFTTGASINSFTQGFAWYDSNENETIDPGVTVSIGELTEEGYSITITQN